MANHDVRNSPTPQNTLRPVVKPTIAELRSAIAGSPQAASYPTAVLEGSTRNDLIRIARQHSITVATSL